MKLSTLAVFTQAPLLVLLVAAGCSRTDTGAVHDNAASDIHHAHGTDHSAALMPPEGQRWATDEPLRAAMTRLRATIEQALAAQENGSPDVIDAQALAQTVEREVAFMIENCKLPPEPDAALHVLIGQMLSAAHKLKESPSDTKTVSELAQALDAYGEHFDHPGWTPLHEHG